MSYVKITDFAGKDSLLTGDPLKIIKGSEIGAEFDAIASDSATNLKKDGSVSATNNIPMGGFKLTGLAAGTSAGDSVRYEQAALLAGATFTGPVLFNTVANIASAATIDLTAYGSGATATVTGTTAISALTMNDGQHMTLVAAGALPLTYNATTFKLDGGQNITLAAGDKVRVFKTGGVIYASVEYAVNYLSSAVASASAVSLTSGADANVTSISVPPGEWWAFGVLGFIPAATTSITRLAGGVGTTSATVNTTTGNQRVMAATVLGATGQREPLARTRLSLSTTTTVYLCAGATFTVSTLGAFGTLYIERA